MLFRAVYHWFTKNSDNMLKGLKLNLQSIMGYKLTNGLLSFVFKHTYLRKVTLVTSFASLLVSKLMGQE